MKPLQRQYRLHEVIIWEVLYKAEWRKIHWEVEFHIKWGVIDPISLPIFLALSDAIDKMPLKKDE